MKDEMKKSTKLLSWIFGIVITMGVLGGIAYSIGTIEVGGGSSQSSSSTTPTTSESPF